jgi:hypothetical protein
MEHLIAEVRRAAQGEDITAIRDAATQLEQAASRFGQSASAGSGGGYRTGNGYDDGEPYGQPNEAGEDVVDAEFRKV